jgi:hypothetical protein
MNDFSENNPDEQPPIGITRELFLEWRSPRFGRSNPERMNNPVWEWLIKSKLSAFLAAEKLNGPDPLDSGPGWCFDRFGQSSTELPDGRIVLIAGEHEDHYDPDFYIYNDVVVQHADGKIEIFGYPQDIFPPTDFHTATLAGNRIIIIGRLSYPEERKPGTTSVTVLNLDTFAISKVASSGSPPGWLYSHNATLTKDNASILVQSGKLDTGGDDGALIENVDDWRLNLADWRWERLTKRQWQQWQVRRKDRKSNHLWEIQQALWNREVRWEKEFQQQMEQLSQEMGMKPDLDLAATLYLPTISHEAVLKKDEEYNIYRIKVDGVVVQFIQEMASIKIIFEGDLPQNTIDAITSDFLGKMTTLENSECELKRR